MDDISSLFHYRPKEELFRLCGRLPSREDRILFLTEQKLQSKDEKAVFACEGSSCCFLI